jgi:hypothetical protein
MRTSLSDISCNLIIHIPYGKKLPLRSDVIHGGGIPIISRKSDKQQLPRLHFYFMTQDQAATPGYIYETNYDNETKLTDMCFHAKGAFKKPMGKEEIRNTRNHNGEK